MPICQESKYLSHRNSFQFSSKRQWNSRRVLSLKPKWVEIFPPLISFQPPSLFFLSSISPQFHTIPSTILTMWSEAMVFRTADGWPQNSSSAIPWLIHRCSPLSCPLWSRTAPPSRNNLWNPSNSMKECTNPQANWPQATPSTSLEFSNTPPEYYPYSHTKVYPCYRYTPLRTPQR